MNLKVTSFIVLAGFILCTSANASVVTSYFCFDPGGCNASTGALTTTGSAKPVSDGTIFNGTAGGAVSVYADQANLGATNDPFATGATSNPIYSSTTENGMFEVSDVPNNRGVGIAPYNPKEGSSGSYSNQDGLTDSVGGTKTDNFLLLDLTGVAQGSTVSLLLQAGVAGDTFDVYTAGGSNAPTSFNAPVANGGMTKMNTANNGAAINVTENGYSQPNGTSTGQGYQFTFTKSTAGTSNEWIAISADCHYLLLTEMKITTSTSAVPEPRFYGLLLAGMLGLAGIYARKRSVVEDNA